jgi:hypothetical protein
LSSSEAISDRGKKQNEDSLQIIISHKNNNYIQKQLFAARVSEIAKA